jgi:predicted nuclease of predicted toxin-antitoxin system
MKFLLDAQLPRRLAVRLQAAEHDAIHTLDLPPGNRTSDSIINEISSNEDRVVVTKDADFVNSFLIARRPYKLLLISTGNIKNNELEIILLGNIKAIVESFISPDFIEISRTSFMAHI